MKRIGVAYGDFSPRIITPLNVLDRGGRKAEKEILSIIVNRNIKTVIIGNPLNEDGSPSKQCEDVNRFYNRLLKRSNNVLYEFVDEYGSSEEAMELIMDPINSLKKDMLDSIAASIILSRYFEQIERAMKSR